MESLFQSASISGYIMFGNAILMLSASFMLLTFVQEIKRGLKIWPLFGALFFSAISRIVIVFGILTGTSAVQDYVLTLTFIYCMFFVEYAHQCFSGESFNKSSLKLHVGAAVPVGLLLYYSQFYSVARCMLTTFSLLTVLVSVLAACRLAGRVLPKNAGKFVFPCFLSMFIMGLSQALCRIEHSYDITAFLSDKNSFITVFYIIEIFLVFVMAACISASNYTVSNHKRPQLTDYQAIIAPILVPLVIAIITSLAALTGLHLERLNAEESKLKLNELSKRSLSAVNMLLNISSKFAKALSELPLFQSFIEDGSNYGGTSELLAAFAQINPSYSCAIIDVNGRVKLATANLSDLSPYQERFKSIINEAGQGKAGESVFLGQVGDVQQLFICNVSFNHENKPIGMVTVLSGTQNLLEILKFKQSPHGSIINDSNQILLSPKPELVGCFISADPNKMVLMDSNKAPLKSYSRHLFSIKSLIYTDWKLAILLPWAQSLPQEQFLILLAITFVSISILLFFAAVSLQKDRFEVYEELQERFKVIFSNAPESILVISSDELEILETNDSTLRQFEMQEMVGKNYNDLLVKGAASISNIQYHKETNFFKHHRDFIKSTGEVFTADVMGAPCIFMGKRAIMLLLRDITSLKQAGLELLRAKETAESAGTLKSRFFANASHEIRTPMNAIIGLSEFAYDLAENPDQRRILQLMRSSSQSLLRLINNILDLSAIESGKLDVKLEPTRIKQLAAELIMLIKGTLGGKPLEICAKISPNMPDVILTDSVKLRQIMLNLLSNSAKHTDTGSVTLFASIITQEGKTQLECRVEDTGHGITPELRESIFMPFIHGSYQGSSGVNGTGLGLSICQQLVDLLGGSIGLDSTGPKGSVFSFRIPVEVVPEVKSESADSTGSLKADKNTIAEDASLKEEMAGFALVKSDKTQLNVLVADDNEVNLFLAGSLIEKFKGMFSCANNGQEALDLYEKTKFDLALIDIQMPVLDGVSAIKEIRKLERSSHSHLPIIAISAFASGVERDIALDAGADRYLAKPYFPKDLLNLIKETLGEKVFGADEKPAHAGLNDAPKAPPKLLQVDEKELRARILDKANNLIKISEIYSRRSKELIEKLQGAKDGAELREYAHSCKGLVGMLGAKNSFELSLKIELLAKDGKFDEARFFVPELIRHINEIETDLKTLKQSL